MAAFLCRSGRRGCAAEAICPFLYPFVAMTVRFAGLCLRAGGACLTLALCWPPILARAEAPSVLIRLPYRPSR